MPLIEKISFLFILSLFVNISNGQINNPGTALNNIEAQTKTGIVLAGSSITWGDGNLCYGFSGKGNCGVMK